MHRTLIARGVLAALHGLDGWEIRHAQPGSPQAQATESQRQHVRSDPLATEAKRNPGRIERIRQILASNNLTVYRLSVLTRQRFSQNRSYHIPRNFYFQLRSAQWTPTLGQLVALSELTNTPLNGWLLLFGFRLQDTLRLQTLLPRRRTTLLESRIVDPTTPLFWFESRLPEPAYPSVAPLTQLLEGIGLRPLSSLPPPRSDGFSYAKIGCQDAFAFPDLLPGSIVRADPQLVERFLQAPDRQPSQALFLVEHNKGYACCRLRSEGRNHFTLLAGQLPLAEVDLRLGTELRVLGVLDLEFRPLAGQSAFSATSCTATEPATDLATPWKPALLRKRLYPPSALLLEARKRAGLSFRDASELSRQIAAALRDPRYYTSPGSLSDYESSDAPPRHIHKVLTLCILYSIKFEELLSSFRLGLENKNYTTTPHSPIAADHSKDAPITNAAKTPAKGFLENLMERFGEIPYFLRDALPSISGLISVTLRDVFWVGGQQPLHPALMGALFVIVNRHRKKPIVLRHKQSWEQPPYLVRRRDGSYLLASCSVENGFLIVHPPAGTIRSERLRNGVDAEVVGQIVTVVRSLASPP